MSDMITIQGQVTEDGQLIVQLPPDAPRGTVQVTVKRIRQYTPEEEAAADAEFMAMMNDPATFTGTGLTVAEIMDSPLYGIWANREDVPDSAEYVAEMRRRSRERRMHRED
ncbi:MAG: hypothetical protein K8J31_04490 [Anaerolineae bacterium]|nr:hypothetical protein [Anaerolineae bacterium]